MPPQHTGNHSVGSHEPRFLTESTSATNTAADFLIGVGEIFQAYRQTSWHPEIVLTDDETAPHEGHEPLNRITPAKRPRSSHDEYDAVTPAPSLTPAQQGPFLPASEMPELMRRRAKRHKRNNSTNDSRPATSELAVSDSQSSTGTFTTYTAGETNDDDAHTPRPLDPPAYVASISHTPPHHSDGTVEEEDYQEDLPGTITPKTSS